MPVTGTNINGFIGEPSSQVGAFSPRCLVIGQQDKLAIAKSGALVKNIISKGQVIDYFGRDSHIAQGIFAAQQIASYDRYTVGNNRVIIDAMAFDDPDTGAFASSTLTITGTAIENGSYSVTIASKYNFTKIIDIVLEDTSDIIAAKIKAQFDVLDVPCFIEIADKVVGQEGTTLNIKTSFRGMIGNDMPIEVNGHVNGLTLALTKFTGGTENPIDADAIDLIKKTIEDIKYDYIYLDKFFVDRNLPFLTFIDKRLNQPNKVVAGILLTCIEGEYEPIKTYLDNTNNMLYGALCIRKKTKIDATTVAYSNMCGELPIVLGCRLMATRAIMRTQDAYISDIVPNSSYSRGRGAPSYTAVGLLDIIMPNTLPIDIEENFKSEDLKSLSLAGALLLENNYSQQAVSINSNRLTYKYTPDGDPAIFTRLSERDTILYIRDYAWNFLRTRWINRVMTKGAYVPGTSQIDKEDAIEDIMEIVNILSGSDDDGVVYGFIPRNTTILQNIRDKVTETMLFRFASRSITADLITEIVLALENALITVVPQLSKVE